MRNHTLTLICLVFASCVFAQTGQPNEITICWDNSLSMVERDLEKEFSILSKVFERHPESKVQLLVFSSGIQEQTYQIKEGDWSALKQDLGALTQDGATIFKDLNPRIQNQQVYVFTDGAKLWSKDNLGLYKGNMIINSSPRRNEEFLQKTALINRARLMDLAGMPSKAEQEATGKLLVSGTIFKNGKRFSKVAVRVEGGTEETFTDEAGKFSIPAAEGDRLQIKEADGTLHSITVTNPLQPLNFFIDKRTIVLDEVVLEERTLEKKTLVNTGLGWQEKESVGYAISSIDDSEIKDVTTKIDEAVSGKVPGLNVSMSSGWDSKGTLSLSTIRGRNTINMNPFALVVIDGTPVQQTSIASTPSTVASQTPHKRVASEHGFDANVTDVNLDYIDPDNIASVTVLKGLAATNAYGSAGANGVILITTKAGTFNTEGDQKVDRARLKNNVYQEEGLSSSREDSPFMKALKKAANSEAAYQEYLSWRALQGANPLFYLDGFNYFKENDPERAIRIISNLYELYPDDLSHLKTVQMALSSVKAPTLIGAVTNRILELAPTDIQGRYNRAVDKANRSEYEEALGEMLKLTSDPHVQELSSTSMKKTLDRDIKNLLYKNKGKMNSGTVDPKYLNNIKYDLRVVFEWNDPSAEFEIQFVNPQKRFYKWENSYASDAARFKDGIRKGYAMEEFEVHGAQAKGEWIINAQYLEQKEASAKPLVLKSTLYTNFGTPNQKKEEVVLYFSNANEKKQIKKFTIL